MSNFEERLLSALKEEITTRTAEDGMTIVTPARRPRRRLVGLTAAVAGVAAAATAAVLLFNGAPAYAVAKGADGSVSVQINSFTDPEGLERELAAAGVKAVVDYLPQGQFCKEPRGARGSATGQFAASVGKGSDGISFKIEKGQVPSGETLVLAVSKSAAGDDQPPFAMSLAVVKGAVAECEPVAAPAPGGDGGVQDKKDDGGAGVDFREEGGDNGPSLTEKTE